jgi:glutamyl-tRNA synthetase
MTDKSFYEENEKKIPMGRVRTRFAPSPTGYMHIGNLRTALYTYFIARNMKGDFILRIEDTDRQRLVSDAVDIIYETLEICGLECDESPLIGGPVGPYVQSERKEIYGKYAELLIEKGFAYRCFCEKIEPEENYDEHDEKSFERTEDPCRNLSREESERLVLEGREHVVRQRIEPVGSTKVFDEIFGEIEVPNEELDEQVLIKRDGLPTYNFANVVDDHLMGISHVVRGTEYLSSAPKYNLLYKAFGWELPKYVHCPPVMRDAQNKLSKRRGDPSFQDLLEKGFIPEAIVNYCAFLGWSPGGEREIYSLEELCEIFKISGISKSPSIFDIEKLKWMNSEYLRNMSLEKFLEYAEPYIRQTVKNPNVELLKIAAILQKRTEVLTEIPGKLGFIDELPDYDIEFYTNKKSKTNPEVSLQMLHECKKLIADIEEWNEESIKENLISRASELGVKNATLMWPLRIAVSGELVTPGGAVEICDILGKEECLKRIGHGIDILSKEA